MYWKYSGSKCANTPYTTDTSRRKCVHFFVNNIYIGNISTVWHRKLYMKAWYSSKIFLNFICFSCLIFLAQNVLIHPGQKFADTTGAKYVYTPGAKCADTHILYSTLLLRKYCISKLKVIMLNLSFFRELKHSDQCKIMKPYLRQLIN